jgi:hypothetical protein
MGPLDPSDRGTAGMVINLAGRAWASLGVRRPARHDPLANPTRPV